MKWAGPEYWGNRLQDWAIENEKLVCKVIGANRNLHLLTLQQNKVISPLHVGVTVDYLTHNDATESCFGIRLGAKGPFEDYRSAAVFGKGLDIGLAVNGDLKFGEKTIKTGLEKIPNSFTIDVLFQPKKENCTAQVKISNPADNAILFTETNLEIPADAIQGNFALISHASTDNKVILENSVSFSNWFITSDNLHENENQIFGPICFAQYTLHQQKLKLTAQLAPIEEIENHKIEFQLKVNNAWQTIATAKVKHIGRALNFTVADYQNTEDQPYRIVAEIELKNNTVHQYFYEGTIAKEPVALDEVKTAVFSCNFHFGFPDQDVCDSIATLNPDVILFLGDQFYEGTGGFGVEYSGELDKQCLDYLRKWMLFGWSYREIFRHRPCAIIPDDHDVYHGNVWGEGGTKADISNGFGKSAQDSGGYKMPAEWVNMVQFTQTSHLPDPYDATPVKQGIRVYYTNWNYAGISFAILEDRKFKSAPKNVLPAEAKIDNGWIQNPDFDIKKYRDVPATLLGERQELFLANWVKDWQNAEMKVVLSQTNFATVATLPMGTKNDSIVPKLPIPEKGDYVLGDAPTVDMDSNGWPANKRDSAVSILRKSFAFHIAGDQHLASFIKYGVEEHGDSGYAFAGPALNNIWPRRFWPNNVDFKSHTYTNPAYTGNHTDGFGNKMTVKAIANPFLTKIEPAILHNRATGFGLVTFNKKNRTIKTECWPRYNELTKGKTDQFPGWPITVKQQENYGRKAAGYLPEITVTGMNNAVMQLYNENTNELVYAIRLNGKSFTPKVFEVKAKYRIKVGSPELNVWQEIKGINTKRKRKLKFNF